MIMTKFNNFYDAYKFLENHHIFEDKKFFRKAGFKQIDFLKSLDIQVVKVNPETRVMEDDKSLNTLKNIWLECGPYEETDSFEGFIHDIDLDVGGNTFEEAIVNLAHLVFDKYGENPDGYDDDYIETPKDADSILDDRKIVTTARFLATILQFEMVRNSYELKEVEYLKKGEVPEREFGSDAFPKLFRTVGLTTVPTKRLPVHTCINVNYAEEHPFGLRIFLNEGNEYDMINVYIKGFIMSDEM
jgi:hypothetical protein